MGAKGVSYLLLARDKEYPKKNHKGADALGDADTFTEKIIISDDYKDHRDRCNESCDGGGAFGEFGDFEKGIVDHDK